MEFRLQPVGPSHTPEDLVVYVPKLRVLFAGDLVFRGRVPFVGQADSGHWISALDALLGLRRSTSSCPATGRPRPPRAPTCELTRDYLAAPAPDHGRGGA